MAFGASAAGSRDENTGPQLKLLNMSSRQLFASAVRTGVVTAGVALCLATTPSAQQQMARQITVPYQMFTLANGLTVILHEDHSVPIVSINVWYHAGSANEKVGRTGFAHLFEHLMFEGSKNVKE